VQDAMSRWYCCNDSYVTLSTLQEVLSEKAYILFFTRTSPRPISAGRVVISNGVKSHEINGNNTVKNAQRVNFANTVEVKSCNVPPLVKDITVASKVGDASGSLQNKFSNLANSFSKRAFGHINGKADVQKRESVDNNGNVDKHMNGNHASGLEKDNNSNNKKQSAAANSHFTVNGDGHHQDRVVSMKGDLRKENGLKGREVEGKVFSNGTIHNGQPNGHADISGSKRKLEERDSCILLAKDSQSRARVEDFKTLYVS